LPLLLDNPGAPGDRHTADASVAGASDCKRCIAGHHRHSDRGLWARLEVTTLGATHRLRQLGCLPPRCRSLRHMATPQSRAGGVRPRTHPPHRPRPEDPSGDLGRTQHGACVRPRKPLPAGDARGHWSSRFL